MVGLIYLECPLGIFRQRLRDDVPCPDRDHHDLCEKLEQSEKGG